MSGREIHWKVRGRDVVVRIEELDGRGLLHYDDKVIEFTIRERNTNGGWVEIDGTNHRFFTYHDRNEFTVWLDGRTYRLQRFEKGRTAEESASGTGGGEVRSLMPGKVLRIDVSVGDSVAERQPVVIMESMKMESSLAAPRAGTIAEVRCQVGQVVDMGELLVVIE